VMDDRTTGDCDGDGLGMGCCLLSIKMVQYMHLYFARTGSQETNKNAYTARDSNITHACGNRHDLDK